MPGPPVTRAPTCQGPQSPEPLHARAPSHPSPYMPGPPVTRVLTCQGHQSLEPLHARAPSHLSPYMPGPPVTQALTCQGPQSPEPLHARAPSHLSPYMPGPPVTRAPTCQGPQSPEPLHARACSLQSPEPLHARAPSHLSPWHYVPLTVQFHLGLSELCMTGVVCSCWSPSLMTQNGSLFPLGSFASKSTPFTTVTSNLPTLSRIVRMSAGREGGAIRGKVHRYVIISRTKGR